VTEPLVRIEALYHRYEEGTPALEGIDLEIADNAFLAIVGQNGSGKTTLVKHLNGLLKPTSGRVIVDGVDTATTSVARLARTVGFVFQNPDHQIFSGTTRDEISFGLRNLGWPAETVADRTQETLEAFGLEEYAEVPPAVLGFGLRRKVAVASIYAMRPRILVLDEPTTGLDWRSAQDLLRRLVAMHREGHTILLVTHDMRIVAEYAPETLVMHAGRVLAYGPTREVFATVDLEGASISPPQATRLAGRLADLGMDRTVLTVDEFCAAYVRALEGRR